MELLKTILPLIFPLIFLLLHKFLKKEENKTKNEAENLMDKTFHDLHLWLINNGINISKAEVFSLRNVIKVFPSKRIVDIRLSRKNKIELFILGTVGLLFVFIGSLPISYISYSNIPLDFKTTIFVGIFSAYLTLFGYYILLTTKPQLAVLRIQKATKKNRIRLD